MEAAMIAEQMFYIVDARGNFYRVNDKDQLIVSPDRGTADLFGLKEANKRINNGKKMYFYSILPASSIRDEAQEVLKVATEAAQELVFEYDLDQLDWKEYLTHFSYVVSGLKKYQDKLNKDLSEVDMCICDLMHYLELYDMEDVDYIKAAELIKQYREKRRMVKDKFHMTEKFQEAIGTNNNLLKAKSAITQIDKLQHRIYTPRMLPEIFAGELKPTKKKEYYRKQEGGMEQMDYVVQVPWTGQEEQMTESREKRATCFEGSENDWSGFVTQQATFFSDAKQYVCNLQVTLAELDEEIEQILSDVEEANCNAVQGYKVFKQLKDLRNERKRVAKEFECVQTIIGCFDCEAMRDAYRYCEGRIQEIVGQ